MQTVTTRYLDAVQVRLGLPSDYALAKHWGITHQRISEYRRGVKALGEDRCFQVAEILGIPPETVLLEIQAERARKAGKTSVSEVLESVLRRLQTITATLAAASFSLWLLTYSGDSAANALGITALSQCHFYDFGIIYIMSNRTLLFIQQLARLPEQSPCENPALCQVALSSCLLQRVIVFTTAKSLHFGQNAAPC